MFLTFFFSPSRSLLPAPLPWPGGPRLAVREQDLCIQLCSAAPRGAQLLSWAQEGRATGCYGGVQALLI